MAARRALCSPARARTLALGQAISALIAGTGIASTALVERGIDLPLLQSTPN
jgi:solute carrier family 35, member F1/2